VETILAEAAHLGKFCSGHLDLIDVLMASTEVAKRLPLGPNPFERPMPLAEHGFSVLIKVKQGHKEGQVLFDAGVSRRGVLNNIGALEINLADVQAIILSHGHPDHAMGLPGVVDRLGTRNILWFSIPMPTWNESWYCPLGMKSGFPPLKWLTFGVRISKLLRRWGLREVSNFFDILRCLTSPTIRLSAISRGHSPPGFLSVPRLN
jgi:hypothetical protein